jgi:thiol-disulfide isomerase/thioredoxin
LTSLRSRWLIGAALVASAVLAYRGWQGESAAVAPPPEVRSAAFWNARLPDLANTPQPFAQWLGKVLVVNFWASCCVPCQKEIPGFIALQKAQGGRGLQFVGIAVEPPDKAGAYAAKVGMNYPILQGEATAEQLFQDAGNRVGGMPYTVVFDRQGNAVAAITGEVARERLENIVRPLL